MRRVPGGSPVELSSAARGQLKMIARVQTALEGAGLCWWLFGGWGLDALLGRVTREHGDIEVWVAARDATPSRDVLVAAGAEECTTKPVNESREYLWDQVSFSTAYYRDRDDGTYGVSGRWDDWVFPGGSFGDDRGHLAGLTVPVMSPEGMLAMKTQYSSLRNGGPPRDKDLRDIPVLQQLTERSSLDMGPRSESRDRR